ncbi:MAG: NifB/NifX family molybdenum-iron cluster-binding protein [Desulfobacterales bacterium]|nr:NifB/NifX family molybdenum-iron cluster-binding protein [Desulfobacterales bacterium]
MKIAVSSKGQSLQDGLDPSFGRCPGFVVFDTDTQNTSFLDNSRQQDLAQGAGIKTAQMVSNAGVDVLISGKIGPKAMEALGQSRMQIFSSSAATVREAIEAWQRNSLSPVSTATGQPGGGQGMGGGGGGRGRSPAQGGQGKGGGARGRGPGQGGQGMGGGAKGKGPGQGGRGKGGGGKGGLG